MQPDRKEPTAPSKSHFKIFRLMLILASLTGFASLATDMYLAGISLLADTFKTDLGIVQFGLSVVFLGLAFGQLLYGPLIHRLGRKRPLLLGVGLLHDGMALPMTGTILTCAAAAGFVWLAGSRSRQ